MTSKKGGAGNGAASPPTPEIAPEIDAAFPADFPADFSADSPTDFSNDISTEASADASVDPSADASVESIAPPSFTVADDDDDDDDEPIEVTEAPPGAPLGGQPTELQAMSAALIQFMTQMEQRLARSEQAADERLARLREELRAPAEPPPPPIGNPAEQLVGANRVMAPPRPSYYEQAGMLPPPSTMPGLGVPLAGGPGYAPGPPGAGGQTGYGPAAGNPATSGTAMGTLPSIGFPTQSPPPSVDMQRLVAFIPKENQLNPKIGSFDTWVNGQLVRIKRGEIGMLPLGHALDLARNGHGHVVDIDAMSTYIPPQTPDLSDPDTSDGLVGQQVPRTFWGRMFAQ